MENHWDIIIIGGGIAGFSAAKAISEKAPATRLLLINGEDRIPYKRTKLSKFIATGFETNQFQLQPEAWYRDHHIQLLSKKDVLSIEPQDHILTLKTGEHLHWNKLILATGARAILPENIGHEGDGVYVVRHAEEVEQLILASKRDVRTVLVVGMGVLGVEVAEQAYLLNKEVILAGISPTIMPRQLNTVTSEMMQACFEKNGITLMFQEKIISLIRTSGHILEIELKKNRISADLVVFCIGAAPKIELAQSAGLEVNSGIVVNKYLQTSHPDIFAAGDAAEHPGGKITGLWHAAEFQGMVAGENALGPSIFHEQPPFRLKCEVFGQYFFSINKPETDDLSSYVIVEKRPGNMYQCFYYQENTLKSVIMVNDKTRAKQYEQAAQEGWKRKQAEEFF